MMRAPKTRAEIFFICWYILLITAISYKIYIFLNFPDFQQNSKFPWQILKFPDFSLTLNFPDFSLTSGNPVMADLGSSSLCDLDIMADLGSSSLCDRDIMADLGSSSLCDLDIMADLGSSSLATFLALFHSSPSMKASMASFIMSTPMYNSAAYKVRETVSYLYIKSKSNHGE